MYFSLKINIKIKRRLKVLGVNWFLFHPHSTFDDKVIRQQRHPETLQKSAQTASNNVTVSLRSFTAVTEISLLEEN